MDISAYRPPAPDYDLMLLPGAGEEYTFGAQNYTNMLEYSPVTDTAFGSFIAVFSILGFVFNIITVWACGLIRKKNCSKVRLATSLFIFHLSLSDSIYSLAQLFSAVTLLLAGRRDGIVSNVWVDILCNVTGVLFNITIRSSLWFVTALTFVRYFAVCFPLKMPLLVTERRIYVLAAVVWVTMLVISIVPFTLNVEYKYAKDISICIWSVDMLNLDRTSKLWTHVMLLVLPMLIPGLIVVCLYSQIVWKVIQLKSVHMRIKAGKYEKVAQEKETPIKRIRKPLSIKLNSISLSLSRSRPLSLLELEIWERETEGVDADLINNTVLSLRGLKADKETDEKSYKRGVVAYYVNRFIVKTAGQQAFERIQSNSFTAVSCNRESLYETECPVSLNHYDCPMDQSGSPPQGRTWQLRKGSGFSLCDDPSNPTAVRKEKRGNKYNTDGKRSSARLPSVVEEMMTEAKNQQTEKKAKGFKLNIPGDITEARESTSLEPPPAVSKFQNAVKSCKNDVCSDQETVLPAITKKPFKVNTSFDQEQTLSSHVEDSTPPSSEQQSAACIMPIDQGSQQNMSSMPSASLEQSSIPYQYKLPTENKFKLKMPAEMQTYQEPEREVRSPPGHIIQRQFTKFQNAFKSGKQLASDSPEKKRIRRLDLRLNIIITSCLFTLFLVTVFCLCYSLWWILSIDILKRYATTRGVLDVSYTTWCNMIILSFSTILLNTTLNPIIYFYYAHRQAMLDVVRVKLKRYRVNKWRKGAQGAS